MIRGILSLANIAGALKKVKRKGWTTWVGIENPESVAEHSFRCAVLAMCIGDLKKLNTEKLIKITLLHDIHEALTGDYDYFDKQRMGKGEVHKREAEAVKKLSNRLPKKIRDEYLSLWNEFESQETEEAKLAISWPERSISLKWLCKPWNMRKQAMTRKSYKLSGKTPAQS